MPLSMFGQSLSLRHVVEWLTDWHSLTCAMKDKYLQPNKTDQALQSQPDVGNTSYCYVYHVIIISSSRSSFALWQVVYRELKLEFHIEPTGKCPSHVELFLWRQYFIFQLILCFYGLRNGIVILLMYSSSEGSSLVLHRCNYWWIPSLSTAITLLTLYSHHSPQLSLSIAITLLTLHSHHSPQPSLSTLSTAITQLSLSFLLLATTHL